MQSELSIKQFSRLKKARLEIAHNHRRVVFNDDSYELDREDSDTPDGFLSRRLKPLIETQVTTIAWSVLGGWADAPVYDSHVQPIYGDAHWGNPKHRYWPNVSNNIKSIIKSDNCPNQVVIDLAHSNSMEMFASMRMNDVHDSFLPGGLTLWKVAHPELLVDTNGMLPEFELYTSAQDFVHEPVRRRKLEIVEEIVGRYDVDGFELDYIRHPVLFSRRMRGEPCVQEEIEVMNAFMADIRALADSRAEGGGRPVLIAARVPDSIGQCLDNGLDVREWIEKDLVDILIVGGGYAPCSLPVGEFIEIARPHGVQVYPCINQGPTDELSGNSFLECVRGLASTWYRDGVDGLYFWNLGTPFEYKVGEDLVRTRDRVYSCLDEVGDPDMLVGKSKMFCADSGPTAVRFHYQHISSRWPLPIKSKHAKGNLQKGVIGRVPIRVGDEVEKDNPERIVFTVEFNDPSWRDVLLFRLNGEELKDGKFTGAVDGKNECRLDYDVSVPPLRVGLNFVEVVARHVDIPGDPVNINNMRLCVDYA